ncbi:MAG TPA: phage holin family protein [Bdellovibrionales bacterium]|nr:phage holin family protein [Bdellovibrionales bacterium]
MQNTHNVHNINPHRAHEIPQTGETINRINHTVQNLKNNYIELAKLYVKDASVAYGQQVAFGVIGGLLLLYGWGLFIASTVDMLSPAVMPFWASLGIWALIHFGVGAFLVMKMINALKKGANDDVTKSVKDKPVLDNELRMRGLVP